MKGWEMVAKGLNHMIRELELAVSPQAPRKGEGLQVESITKG